MSEFKVKMPSISIELIATVVLAAAWAVGFKSKWTVRGGKTGRYEEMKIEVTSETGRSKGPTTVLKLVQYSKNDRPFSTMTVHFCSRQSTLNLTRD